MDTPTVEEVTDDLLFAAVASTRTARVSRDGRSDFGARQSHTARAWTVSGDVD